MHPAAERVKCVISGKEIIVNRFMYAPPCVWQPVNDEGFWCEKLNGHVSIDHFEEAPWSKEELETLQYDWGWEPDPDAQYLLRQKRRASRRPTKE